MARTLPLATSWEAEDGAALGGNAAAAERSGQKGGRALSFFDQMRKNTKGFFLGRA